MVRTTDIWAKERSAATGGQSRAKLVWLAALMGSTALATSPDTALAACVNAGGANWQCSGVNTTGQEIVQDNATVTTQPGFSVDVSIGEDALDIRGAGAVSYVDDFSSPLTAINSIFYGLYIESTGDAGATPGSVTVVTGGDITSASYGVFTRNSGTGATDITITGTVEGGGLYGISVWNGYNATDVRIEAATVTGNSTGLAVSNYGSGATSVRTTGVVQGVQSFGIYVFNDVNTSGLTVEAADVHGGGHGIYTNNVGTGATSITATGSVTSDDAIGVWAYNNTTTTANAAGDGLSIDVQDVAGNSYGIAAANSGAGATRITAGDVLASGANSIGIFATNAVVAGNDFMINVAGSARAANPDATDLVVEAGDVSAGILGIQALNYGTGATVITATGTVIGEDEGGIDVYNHATATDMTIDVVDVNGSHYGIIANNSGIGATDISVRGTITTIGAGLTAFNGTATTANLAGDGLSIDVHEVSGGSYGIAAANSGAGVTRLGAGDVAASGIGVLITNAVVDGSDFVSDPLSALGAASANAAATDLMLEVGNASGGDYGIASLNRGTGKTDLTSTGAVAVTNSTGIGIQAVNDIFATDLTVRAADVGGGAGGIFAINYGMGATSVITNGMVKGSVLAVRAISSTGNAVDVHNLAGGTLRNASGVSSDLAVVAEGGAVTLINDSNIVGTVSLGGTTTRFENNGVWNSSGGTSQFGGAVGSELVNAAGATVFGGRNGALAEATMLAGLPLFTTHGTVALTDGGAGDVFAVSGAASFHAGSTLSVDVGGPGGTDRFISADTVVLNGTTLHVNSVRELSYGTRYNVLTAEGGLTGTFATITGLPAPTAFLVVQDGYDANNAWLESIKYRDFADAGRTPNQIATGQGLDTFPAAGPLFLAVANLPTDAAAQQAFDQLSGEVSASARTTMLQDSRFVRNAVNDRIRAAFDGVGAPSMLLMAYSADGPHLVPPTTPRFGVWGQAFGSWGHWGGNGNAARLDRSIDGFLVGADAPAFDTWRVGIMAGYSRTSFRVKDRNSSGSSDNYHIGLYGGMAWGDLAFRTGSAYTWHDVSTSRSVAFPGFSDRLMGDYKAGTAQVFGELAYGIRAGGSAFEPFANFAYVNLHTDGFTENGGAAALRSASISDDVLFITLGLRGSTHFNVGETSATLKGMIGWRHVFGDVMPNAAMRFAGGDPFSIAGVPLAREAAVIEAGVDFALSSAAALGASYGGQFGSRVRDHSFRANLQVRF